MDVFSKIIDQILNLIKSLLLNLGVDAEKVDEIFSSLTEEKDEILGE